MGNRLTTDTSNNHVRRKPSGNSKRNGNYAGDPPRRGPRAFDSGHSQRILDLTRGVVRGTIRRQIRTCRWSTRPPEMPAVEASCSVGCSASTPRRIIRFSDNTDRCKFPVLLATAIWERYCTPYGFSINPDDAIGTGLQ
jgi:hypothetical protein